MTGAAARALLEEIEAKRRSLRDAAQALGLAGLDEKTSSDWTVKEMLAHVAFWEEAPIGFITGMVRRRQLPEGWRFGSGYLPDPNAPWPRDFVHNAREAEWARSQTAEQVLARWDKAHKELLEFLAGVTDRETADQPAYFKEISDHFSEHLPELQAILGKATTGRQ